MHNNTSGESDESGIGVEEHSKLINLGCGCRLHPAWENYDLQSRRPGVIECDFLKGIPADDGTASAVYSSAVLEHIPRRDVPAFFNECFRVLKPGGFLRLSVPDFEAQARLYLDLVEMVGKGDAAAGEKLEWIILEMIDQAGRNMSGGGMAEFLARKGSALREFVVDRIGKEGSDLIDKLGKRGFSSAIDLGKSRHHLVRGGIIGAWLLKFLLRSPDVRKDLAALEVGRFRLFSGEVHEWSYDRASLATLFRNFGFGDIRVMRHGESGIPGWCGFHLEVDADGVVEKPDLFIVEGMKPRDHSG